jgi:two-component system response regulator NreC
VLDLNMPGGSSLNAIKQVQTFASSTAVVVLTMEHESSFVREAHAAGAVAYVLKDAAETQLVTAIRNAAGRATPKP